MSACCSACKKTKPANSQPGDFWSLRDYHGISGFFCSDCFSDISHDSYGQPNYPNKLMVFKLKYAELVQR